MLEKWTIEVVLLQEILSKLYKLDWFRRIEIFTRPNIKSNVTENRKVADTLKKFMSGFEHGSQIVWL